MSWSIDFQQVFPDHPMSKQSSFQQMVRGLLHYIYGTAPKLVWLSWAVYGGMEDSEGEVSQGQIVKPKIVFNHLLQYSQQGAEKNPCTGVVVSEVSFIKYESLGSFDILICKMSKYSYKLTVKFLGLPILGS